MPLRAVCALCVLDSMRLVGRSVCSSTNYCPRDLTALFGILEPTKPLTTPACDPEASWIDGHWDVSTFEGCVLWSCRCKRSEPLLMSSDDLKTIHKPRGLFACRVCREEEASARGKSGKLWAWLERNRFILDKSQHLYLPNDHGYCTKSEEQKVIRTRRYVYERFWKTKLESNQCVQVKCLDKDCINPYHLWISHSSAQKVSTEIRALISYLIQQGVSTQTIQKILSEQHSKTLSVRSIQKIKTELVGQRSLVT